jgi:hypothetical protein
MEKENNSKNIFESNLFTYLIYKLELNFLMRKRKQKLKYYYILNKKHMKV